MLGPSGRHLQILWHYRVTPNASRVYVGEGCARGNISGATRSTGGGGGDMSTAFQRGRVVLTIS